MNTNNPYVSTKLIREGIFSSRSGFAFLFENSLI